MSQPPADQGSSKAEPQMAAQPHAELKYSLVEAKIWKSNANKEKDREQWHPVQLDLALSK